MDKYKGRRRTPYFLGGLYYSLLDPHLGVLVNRYVGISSTKWRDSETKE